MISNHYPIKYVLTNACKGILNTIMEYVFGVSDWLPKLNKSSFARNKKKCSWNQEPDSVGRLFTVFEFDLDREKGKIRTQMMCQTSECFAWPQTHFFSVKLDFNFPKISPEHVLHWRRSYLKEQITVCPHCCLLHGSSPRILYNLGHKTVNDDEID